MTYVLDKDSQRCGLIYPTYKGFKKIPKATCPNNTNGCGEEISVTLNCSGKDSTTDEKPEATVNRESVWGDYGNPEDYFNGGRSSE